MNIGWIEISIKQYGGNLYNQLARDILLKRHRVELISCEAKMFQRFRPFKLLESLMRLIGLGGKKDVWMRDFYSILTLPFDHTKGKHIVMIHHDDFSGFSQPASFFLSLLQHIFFYRNLRRADAIITVSEYWKRHFLQKVYAPVHVIYNGFDLSQYQISEQEVLAFKKRAGLEGKPIIYLGNCQRAKGVVEAYHQLKGLNVHLVTSGERKVHIPALNFNGSFREYLVLLKASSIVLTMSTFKEGWSRTAHESMLLKIPVIGSGQGGMRELLEGGKQIVCEDSLKLRPLVQSLLNDEVARKKLGDLGYAYASQFSLERFERAWFDTISLYE